MLSEHQVVSPICCPEKLSVSETLFDLKIPKYLHGSILIGFIFKDPKNIKMFVLDEADEMLSRGFKEQIHDVFTKMPYNIQVILLSATMPVDVLDVTKKFMRDPIRILVKKEELTLEGIKQFYIMVGREVCYI